MIFVSALPEAALHASFLEGTCVMFEVSEEDDAGKLEKKNKEDMEYGKFHMR